VLRNIRFDQHAMFVRVRGSRLTSVLLGESLLVVGEGSNPRCLGVGMATLLDRFVNEGREGAGVPDAPAGILRLRYSGPRKLDHPASYT
jgi:hypothetical protein